MSKLFGLLLFISSAGVVLGIDREFGRPIFRTFSAHDYGVAGVSFCYGTKETLVVRLLAQRFLRKLKDQWNQRVERPKNYGQKKNWSAVGAEQILTHISGHD